MRPDFRRFVASLKAAGLEDFQDLATWEHWIVFGKAVLGEPLDPRELAAFRRFTGRRTPRPGGYPEACAVVGRRSGKTRLTSVLAAYLGSYQPIGQQTRGVALVAQDESAAQQVLLEFLKGLYLQVPALGASRQSATATQIRLRNRVVVSTFPCIPEALRGPGNLLAVIDEAGFLRSRLGVPMLQPVLRALRPNSDRLVMLSSSMVEASPLDRLVAKHYGKDASRVLVWRARTEEMNATYDAQKLADLEVEDPEGFAEEFGGQVMKASQRFIEREAIEQCVEVGTFERPPVAGRRYVIGIDASSRQQDSFVASVWHLERDDLGPLAVQDRVREWPRVPPGHDPGLRDIARELAGWHQQYPGDGVLYGDQSNLHYISAMLGEFGLRAEILQVKGIASRIEDHYDPAKNMTRLTTSTALSRCRVPILQRRVLFLDHPKQTSEWAGLILKRTPSGLESVQALGSGHDDHPAAGAWGIVKLLGAGSTLPAPAARALAAHPTVPNVAGDTYRMSAGPARAWGRIYGGGSREQRYAAEEQLAEVLRRRLENEAARRRGEPIPYPDDEPAPSPNAHLGGIFGTATPRRFLGRAVGSGRRPRFPWRDG